MKKRRALLFRREIRNLLRILWHHSSKSLMLLCSLCFSVVPPCTQKFCIHLFSFHIPMMMRSCLSKLVSQAQHLCLTVSKAVTLVIIARKIFCLSFFYLGKQDVRRTYSRYFPGTATVAAGWRLLFLPCTTKRCMFQHQSEAQDQKKVRVSLKNCRSEKN